MTPTVSPGHAPAMRRSLMQAVLALACVAQIHPADAPAPVPLDKTVASIQLPEGFKATLFAGEPDVVQPIAMTTDTRGRLWVVECLSYPEWTSEKTGRDRVLIFEDTDLDGRFDTRKVFLENGRNLSGIALGFGGVWLCSLPELIFVPDRNHDDRPDGPAEALLDGWDLGSKHNVFNNLQWGPDGWLYGCNGILATSQVGKPGAPKEDRTAINCGVWRFHPTRRDFEVVANGTTNPWGIAFDEVGQIFIANCVIKHLFHMVPGARYERMFGQDFNPYSFELIPSIADHIHWAGGYWKTEGAANPQNDVAGGGHAHSGGMIYLGDGWPDEYRGRFFTLNIHGHRLNNDILERSGSGYVAKHAPDFLRVNDSWFRGVAVIPSHDGGIYVADWSDADECHDYEDIHRENGRIYKVQYQSGQSGTERKKAYPDIRSLSDNDLIAQLGARDELRATQARIVLQERAEARNLRAGTAARLREAFKSGATTQARLRALWALHAIGETGGIRDDALADHDEFARGWAIQLALEPGSPSPALLAHLAEMAREDDSPFVRLYLASALQRLTQNQRLPIAAGLARRAEDSNDHNLPLLIWYGIEPIAGSDESAALRLLGEAQLPLIRKFIAQRLTLRRVMNGLAGFLSKTEDRAAQADVLAGMAAALEGQRQAPAPEGWTEAATALAQHPAKPARDHARLLSLIFGDASVIGELKARAADTSLPASDRALALSGLAQSRPAGLAPWLQQALADDALRLGAIQGLAAYGDAATPKLLLAQYAKLRAEEKNETINTLASRADFAVALLEGVRQGAVPARDITPFSARQMHAYKDPRLEPLLKELGTVRGLSKEKAAQKDRYRQLLNPAALAQANLSQGRAIFQRACASCHVLFGEGGPLAPELTGSQRSNLDYILENVVDPNAVVWDRYKASYFETSDDRLISGVVARENDISVTIQTTTGTVTLPRSEITAQTRSELSIMPEGLFDALPDREIIDLVGYLQSPQQVPLPSAP